MIVRIWTTRFDAARLDELHDFANRVSLPMLRRQPGNRGVLFGVDGAEWITMTLWEDESAVRMLDESPDYRDTVASILAAGFLDGDQETKVYDYRGGEIALPANNPDPA